MTSPFAALIETKDAVGESLRLVESDVPLVSSVETGEPELIDLRLEQGPTGYAPENPLVETTIATDVAGGVSLPDLGVRVTAGAASDPPARVEDKLFFANLDGSEADLLVSPEPGGVQFQWQVRSAASPEQQALRFDLPRGYELEPLPGIGGAQITNRGKRLAGILPPTATDADGIQIEVSYTIKGNRLLVDFPHRGKDVKYPLLVDPEILETYNLNPDGMPGTGGNSCNSFHTYPDGWWATSSAGSFAFNASVNYYENSRFYAVDWGCAMSVLGRYASTQYATGEYAQWVRPAYRYSYISRADLRATHTKNRSCLIAGVYKLNGFAGWNVGTWKHAPQYYGGNWGNSPFIYNWPQPVGEVNNPCVGFAENQKSHTPGYHQGTNQPLPDLPAKGNAAILGFDMHGTSGDSKAAAHLHGSLIWMGDYDVPRPPAANHSGRPSDSTWVHRAQPQVTSASTTDDRDGTTNTGQPGLGVKYFNLFYRSSSGLNYLGNGNLYGYLQRKHHCTGDRWSRCPATWGFPDTTVSPPQYAISYDTNNSPEGAMDYHLVPYDVLVKPGPDQTWTIKIDRSKPNTPGLQGTLYDSRDNFLPPGSHTLTTTASDAYSGAKSIAASIRRSSGPTTALWESGTATNPNCTPNGCNSPSASFTFPTWTVPGAALDSEGRFRVHVTTKDFLGDDPTYGSSHTLDTPSAFVFEIDATKPGGGVTPSGHQGWFKDTQNLSATLSGTDPGSSAEGRAGIKSFRVDLPGTDPVVRGCGGIGSNRCPQSDSQASTYSTSPSTFPEQGRVTVNGYVKDAAGNESNAIPWTVGIDRTAPDPVERQGSLWEARSTILFEDSYGLRVVAQDGSIASPAQERSGMKRIRISTSHQDGPFVERYSTGDRPCAAGSCALDTDSGDLNQQADPGFESGNLNAYGGMYEGVAAVVSSPTYEGSKALRMTQNAATPRNPHQYTADIPVVPGAKYRASARFRPQSTLRSARVGYRWVDANHNPLAWGATATASEIASSWVRPEVIDTAPPGAAYVRMFVQVMNAAQNEQHYVDALDLQPLPFALRPSDYPNGRHTIRVEATDQLGQTAARDFDVYVANGIGSLPSVIPPERTGLEGFWNYDSVETGAGTGAYVNLATGNLVWHSVPVVNPGRGLSTVVNLTYNSQETFREALLPEDSLGDLVGRTIGGQYNQVGRGFSLGISGLTRLNEPLDLGQLNPVDRAIALTDVDGTRHTFTSTDNCETFKPPKGVQLHLRRFSGPTPLIAPTCSLDLLPGSLSEPEKAWAMTRPDGVTFFFDRLGYQTRIEDRNGNVIDFDYEYRAIAGGACPGIPPGTQPADPGLIEDTVCLRRVTEITDSAGVLDAAPNRKLTITYGPDLGPIPDVGVPLGQVETITDHAGRTMSFEYTSDNRGYLDAVTIADGDPKQRRFEFGYEPDTAFTSAGLKRRGLASVEDPRGHVTSFSHATDSPLGPAGELGDGIVSRKRVQTLTKRGGGERSYAYAHVEEGGQDFDDAIVTDARDEEWKHRMDSAARPVELEDPRGARTLLEWDGGLNPADNNVTTLTEAAGTDDQAVTTMTYNENGQLLTHEDPRSGTQTTTLSYLPRSGPPALRSPRLAGATPIDQCQPSGQLPNGSACAVSDVDTITSPNGGVTRFEYEPGAAGEVGNVVERVDAENSSAFTNYVPGGHGNIASETTEAGDTMLYRDYDPSGFPQEVEDPEGGVWGYRYDVLGNLIAVTDPRGQGMGGPANPAAAFTTQLDYDSHDQLLTEFTPKRTNASTGQLLEPRIRRDWTYDGNGNVVTETDGNREVWTREYTDMDRLEELVSPLGETTHRTYDEEDNLTKAVSPKGMDDPDPPNDDFATSYRYDGAGNRVAAIRHSTAGSGEPATLASGFAYDLRGNVTGFADPEHTAEVEGEPEVDVLNEANRRFSFEYDKADNRTARIEDPGAGGEQLRTESGYDANGNLTSEIDPRGTATPASGDFETEYVYDARDLLTDVIDPTDARVHYGLREDGRVESMVTPRGTDGIALGADESEYEHFRTDYTYNDRGEVVRRQLPVGPDEFLATRPEVVYSRNSVGDPTTITDARGNAFTNTFYDTGELRSTQRPSWWLWERDPGNRPEPDPQLAGFGLDVDVPAPGLPRDGVPEVRERRDSEMLAGTGQAGGLPDSEGEGDFGSVDPLPLPPVVPRAGSATFAYDDELRLTSVTDAAGDATTIGQDAVGRITGITRPLDGTRDIATSYGYDPNSNPSSVTEVNGWKDEAGIEHNVVTTFGYDQYDRLVTRTAPGKDASESEITRLEYDANGMLDLLRTPVSGRNWDTEYDALDRLESVENPASELTSFGYDDAGNQKSVTSPRQKTITREFNARNELETVTNPLGEEAHFEYDLDGNQTLTDFPGAGARIRTTMEFDARGMLWKERKGDTTARWTISEHDGNANLRRRINPAGVDANGDPNDAWDGLGAGTNSTRNATAYRYNEDNLLESVHLPFGDVDGAGGAPADTTRWRQDFHYDGPGRVIAIDGPHRFTETCSPQAVGAGPDTGCAWRTRYDRLDSGWIDKQSEQELVDPGSALGSVNPLINYSYDRRGNQTQWKTVTNTVERRVVDGNYQRNGLLGKRTAKELGSDPEPRSTYTYTYNPNRSLIQMEELRPGPATRITDITHDDAERVEFVNEAWKSGKDTRFDYDLDGNVTNRRTDIGSGSVGNTSEKTTSFVYDDAGRETDMHVCLGADISNCTPGAANRTTTTDYHDSDLIESRTKPNGVIESYDFNDAGEVTNITRVHGSNTRKDQDYGYDPNGNRTSDERGEHFYNPRNQLVRWERAQGDHAGEVVEFSLFGSGQISETVDDAAGSAPTTTSYEYGDGDRLVKATATQAGSTTTYAHYCHDSTGLGNTIRIESNQQSNYSCPASGNQFNAVIADGDSAYDYDSFGRTTEAEGSETGAEHEWFAYDGLDRRDTRTLRQGQATEEVFDYSYIGLSERLSREEDEQGEVRAYDYDSQLRRQGQGRRPPSASATYRSYGTDANGSVEGLEEANGLIPSDDKYLYDPYGSQVNDEGGLSPEAQDNPFRFEGFYYDASIKTYDMQARPYRPDIGRFLTPDRFESSAGDLNLQSDPLTQNRYAFAGGNPVNNVEFDGHKKCTATCRSGEHQQGPDGEVTEIPGTPQSALGATDFTGSMTQADFGAATRASAAETVRPPSAQLSLPTALGYGGVGSLTSRFSREHGIATFALVHDIRVDDSGRQIIPTPEAPPGSVDRFFMEWVIGDTTVGTFLNFTPFGRANLGRKLGGALFFRGRNRADDVADDLIVVRGGTGDVPPPGQVFSGAAGRTLQEAASGVPHGQIRSTTARAIREAGGTVRHAPELSRSGILNELHVDICLGRGPCPFGDMFPNPVPKSGRIR